MTEILKRKIVVRVAEEPFEINKLIYNRGSLVITRKGNEHLGKKFDEIVRKSAIKHNTNLATVGTGLVTKGKDFGSGKMRVIKAPRVAVLAGEEVSSRNFGEIWYFFEQQIEYPISVFDASNINSLPFKEFDVLIIPQGSYKSLVTEIVPSVQVKKETSASKLIKNQKERKLIYYLPTKIWLKWFRDGDSPIFILIRF